MKYYLSVFIISMLLCFSLCCNTSAQNSVLINFGSNTCFNSQASIFSLIRDPLSALPSSLANCSMMAQVPDFFNVFIAYNPKNNKVYVADVRTGTETKIWVLDMGLPQNIACPASIPVAPTYSYSYVSNNFEFDNNGDLWSFSNYNFTTGQCNMDKFNVNTGEVISTRVLQFPAGNFPSTIASGDLSILPNGRMFATLGESPSRLYEILNYSSTSSNAAASYLQALPQNCYGIAYLNGQLELTGIDGSIGCYYFDYNISTNTLGAQKSFQLGQAPIDNSSLTPSLGTTKQLVNATRVNANTADITYEIYVRNLGNTIINNINVTDDLGAAFGAANVSNVAAAFVPFSNNARLILNTAYNGTTITDLLSPGQNLPNQTSTTNGYYFKLIVSCRVTNLNFATTYFNSAISKGNIGNSATLSLINVADSSNNGPQVVVDPNNNGNAGEIGENVPTPFNFGILPVKFIGVNATLINKNNALVKWTVATPTINAEKFEIEFSNDASKWISIGSINITSSAKAEYQFNHNQLPQGKLYYRIKETDNDGAYTYSKIVLLHNGANQPSFTIYPNPAHTYIQLSAPYSANGKSIIELFDAVGQKLISRQLTSSTEEINTAGLPDGTYLLKLTYNGDVKTQKVLIAH